MAAGVSVLTEGDGSEAPQRRPRPPRIPRSQDQDQEAESDDVHTSAEHTSAEHTSAEPTDDSARRSHATLPVTADAADIANAWDARQHEGATVAEVAATSTPAVTPQEAQLTPLARAAAVADGLGGNLSTAAAREEAEAPGTPTAQAPMPSTGAATIQAAPDATSASAETDAAGEQAPTEAATPATEPSTDATARDAETMRATGAIPPADAGSDTTPDMASDASAAPIAEAEPQILDSLPWPLVPGLIVDGRYRVEEVVRAARINVGAENVYRATDLRGYERCWSCGATQGENAAHERYCRVCDADLLDFPLRVSERLLAPEEHTGHALEDRESDLTAQDAHAPDTTGEMVTYPHTFTQGQRHYTVAPLREPTPAFLTGVRVVGALASDVGLAHSGEANEDSASLVVFQHPAGAGTESVALALVADGLGGHQDGQEASRIASRVIAEELLTTMLAPRQAAGATAPTQDATVEDTPDKDTPDEDTTDDGATVRGTLVQAVAKANSALCALNAERSTNMGTTVVAALVRGPTAYILWAGDSRAYSFADGTLRRLTSDHSLVEQLVAGGLIAPEERYTHERRNEIYRSLGTDPTLEADIVIQRLSPGMRLLLCSDGLWEMVRDDEIAQILAEARHPQVAVDRLLARANEHGGEDNICAVLIEVGG